MIVLYFLLKKVQLKFMLNNFKVSLEFIQLMFLKQDKHLDQSAFLQVNIDSLILEVENLLLFK
jgi:hypothetical protein